MLSFSGLILIRFLLGQVEGAIGLSIIMLTAGGFVFLFSYSSKVNIVAAFFLVFGLIGLPFTPTAPIWGNLGKSENWFSILIMVITLSILFLGFLKHIFRQREQNNPKESWMQLFYSAGLLLLVLSPWITMIWRFKTIQSLANWSLPIYCLVLIVAMIVIFRKKIWDWLVQKPVLQRTMTPFNLVGKVLNAFFQFEWFFIFLRKIIDLFSQPLKFFVNLLEGDGGLLWAFVFLALISSILIGEILP